MRSLMRGSALMCSPYNSFYEVVRDFVRLPRKEKPSRFRTTKTGGAGGGPRRALVRARGGSRAPLRVSLIAQGGP